MRKLLFAAVIGIGAFACNQGEKTKVAGTMAMPQPVLYSSSFEIGDQKNSAMIIQGSWKDWQDNKLDSMKSWVADDIVAMHSDNSMIKGADSLMAIWKRHRANYSSSTDSIHSVLSVHSTDKNEDWVLVWATSYDTKLDGSKDTTDLMETWRINKQGKADRLYQYERHARRMK